MYVYGMIAFSLLMMVGGCGPRPQTQDSSVVSIRAPQSNDSSMFQSASPIPSNRKACYGISVSGPGITSVAAQSCSPQTGITAGFVASGGVISASVPRGEGRKIDLYLYLMAEGDNSACFAMGASFIPSQLDKIYLLGSVSNVTLARDSEEVTIFANFPGVSENIAKQLSFPSSCIVAAPSPDPSPSDSSPPGNGLDVRSGFRVSSGAQLSTGSGIKLYGRAGNIQKSQIATGSGILLKASFATGGN